MRAIFSLFGGVHNRKEDKSQTVTKCTVISLFLFPFQMGGKEVVEKCCTFRDNLRLSKKNLICLISLLVKSRRGEF